MKVTFETLFNSAPALQRLNAMPLRMKTAYAVSKLLRRAEKELRFGIDKKNAWITELGTAVKGVSSISQTDENWPEFEKRFGELKQVEVELSWEKMFLDVPETSTISAGDIIALEPFFDFEKVEPKG